MRFFYLLSLIRKNNSSTSVNTELSVDSCKAKHLLTIPKLTIFLQQYYIATTSLKQANACFSYTNCAYVVLIPPMEPIKFICPFIFLMFIAYSYICTVRFFLECVKGLGFTFFMAFADLNSCIEEFEDYFTYFNGLYALIYLLVSESSIGIY